MTIACTRAATGWGNVYPVAPAVGMCRVAQRGKYHGGSRARRGPCRGPVYGEYYGSPGPRWARA